MLLCYWAGLLTVTLEDVNTDTYGTTSVHSTRVQDSNFMTK